jgi:sugar lactone lactonase YvrE
LGGQAVTAVENQRIRDCARHADASAMLVALFAGLVLVGSPAPGCAADGADLRLTPIRSVTLQKSAGQVDQVVSTPDGGLIVRDSDYRREDTQAIERYDPAGRLERTIGRFGRAPGEYYRLKQIELDDQRRLWVVDVMGRLSRFDADGRLLGTQLIPRPGYQPTSLALDPARGVFYLGGCLPTRTYLDLGCDLVHRYRLEDGKYERSYLATDQEALSKHLLALEDYLVAVAPDGSLYAADAPLARVYKIDPESAATEVFPLPVDGMDPPGLLPGSGIAASEAAYREAHLIERLAVVAGLVFVSIRAPLDQGGHRLVALDTRGGTPRALEAAPQGRLVGTSSRGTLYFSRRGDGGFEIVEYRLDPIVDRAEQSK